MEPICSLFQWRKQCTCFDRWTLQTLAAMRVRVSKLAGEFDEVIFRVRKRLSRGGAVRFLV